jgi:hypothetical protein
MRAREPVGMTLPLLAVPFIAGALVAGSVVPAAHADSTPAVTAKSSLSAIQAAGDAATAKRVTSLQSAIARATANKSISDADRTTVLATLNADLAAMPTLKATIDGDTTAAQAYADYRTIFTTYRVYAVAIPQSLVAAAADGLTTTAIPKLQAAAKDLAGRIGSHTELQPKLDDMNAQIATAQSDTNGLAAAALAVTPAQFDADSAAMKDQRSKLTAALAAVKQASADGHAIVQGLK